MKDPDWASVVSNPEAFGEAEKEHWRKVAPVIESTIDELWRNDKIETVFEPEQKDRFLSCITRTNDLAVVSNTFLHLTDSREKAAKFTGVTKEFGFDESKIVSSYVFSAFNLAMLKIELFKMVLLFHMKVDDYRIDHFPRTICNAAPNSWKSLQPLVDFNLRNPLGHGTYSVLDKRLLLFKDAQLNSAETMELADFTMRAKRQDVMLQCQVQVLKEKSLWALG